MTALTPLEVLVNVSEKLARVIPKVETHPSLVFFKNRTTDFRISYLKQNDLYLIYMTTIKPIKVELPEGFYAKIKFKR